MVYLHGGAAIGRDNVTQVLQTPDYMLDEAKQRGAYLYVPQAPVSPTGWVTPAILDAAMSMIDLAILEKNVDADRLYLTGYSNGGGGTWSLLSRNHGRFAAAITMSSIIPAPGFNPANLLGTAILALHARDDATVPVARTRTVINGILAAAGESLPTYTAAGSDMVFLVSNPDFAFHRDVAASIPPGTIKFLISRNDLDLVYLETPDGGHTGLLGAFYSPDVYSWLFDHSLAVPEPTNLVLVAHCLMVLILARPRSGRPAMSPCRSGWLTST
jgi:predicted peptidase